MSEVLRGQVMEERVNFGAPMVHTEAVDTLYTAHDGCSTIYSTIIADDSARRTQVVELQVHSVSG
jgi:hypothetical protein